MQFHAKYQDNSWCPNGARSEKTMLHRVMDTNNKIRKMPVFTGFLRTIYAALCGNIRGFSRFTPLEMLCFQKEPRVRIPNSPPKSPVNNRAFWTFLFCSIVQNQLKTMERTGRFLERTRRFRAFWRIRTVKISSFRHRLKFRSICY